MVYAWGISPNGHPMKAKRKYVYTLLVGSDVVNGVFHVYLIG